MSKMNEAINLLELSLASHRKDPEDKVVVAGVLADEFLREVKEVKFP